jgi:hypothetical protein
MSQRTLQLTSPLMCGGDVRLLQRTVNTWLRAWQVPHLLDEDGEFGPESQRMSVLACYGLGVPIVRSHRITPPTRIKLRDPARRTLTERRRGDARAEWRQRLKRRFEAHGAAMAITYASHMADLRVSESPPGSNRGERIDQWNRMAGIAPGPAAYWCGAFCNACLVAAGFHPMPFMSYCPAIEQHAKADAGGWTWHAPGATPRAGWLVLFTEGGVAGHVELVVASGWPLRTIGGNTSAGDGSPNNGGAVCRHDFSRYRGLTVRGYAAPPYDR